ncbi:four helix bundle protein [Leptospira sp. 96542]|nr:four helix bundle protein [Leptospira sp. 96542]
MSLAKDLDIYQAARDLLTFALEIQAHISKAYRATLGAPIGHECMQIVLRITKANKARDASRAEHIAKLQEHLESVTVLLRSAFDLKQIGNKAWARSIELTDSVSKQAAGWLKKTAGDLNPEGSTQSLQAGLFSQPAAPAA